LRIEDEISNWGQQLFNKFNNIDLSPIYPQIIAVVRRSIVTNFQTGGRYGSDIWGGGETPWKPSKRAIKQGGKTLRDKGLLLNSIQVIVERNGPGKGFTIKLATNLPYAAIHQFGGQIHQAARSETFKRAKSKTGKFKKMTARQRLAQGIQQGMSVGARVINIPARPYLVLQQADIQSIGELVKKFFAKYF
jgi:phage gpG-like protein